MKTKQWNIFSYENDWVALGFGNFISVHFYIGRRLFNSLNL